MSESPQHYGVPVALWDNNTEELSKVLGFFLVSFGRLEMVITALLADVLGYENDYERFGILSQGLDAKTKVLRLKLAARRYRKPVGGMLRKSLADFVKTDCAIRNSICHSWPTLDRQGIVHFGSLHEIPDYLGRGPRRPLGINPPAHAIGHIYFRAIWMHNLERSLLQLGRVRPLPALEVADPTPPSATPTD